MRREVLFAVIVLGIAACGSPAPQKNTDAGAPALEPAVVNAPLNLPKLPEPAAPQSTLIPNDQGARNNALLQGYSMVTATMANRDSRMLAQMYAPSAVFQSPDSTIKGQQAVVLYLINLAQSKSLSDFQRITHGQRILDDSTLADSGLYRMILKRSAKDSTVQDGRYKSTWRVRKDISQWVMLEDAITPNARQKKRGAK